MSENAKPRRRWVRRIAVGAALTLLAALIVYGLIPGRTPAANPVHDLSRHRVVALFGATGTVGDGVLEALLAEPGVSKIHVVTRRASARIEEGVASGTVQMHVHTDYLDYAPLADVLPEVDAVYWALGTSAANVDDAKYSEIHVDFPLAFVRAWLGHDHDDERSFHLVTGQGTSADSWQHWAREKARAETEIIALAGGSTMRVVAYRPTYVAPSEAQSRAWHTVVHAVFSPFDLATRATEIGRAMLEVTARGGEELPHGTILENKDLLQYSAAYRSR
ncbi:MAG: NAD-dependent epimerase/dehydratase family protein [Myxococcota bacterium]